MIFQEPMTSLNPVHTALDQVVEVLMLHRPEIPRSERRARGRAAAGGGGDPRPRRAGRRATPSSSPAACGSG